VLAADAAVQERANDKVVAQTSSLLYRSASSLQTFRMGYGEQDFEALPIRDRRYSRLETCATIDALDFVTRRAVQDSLAKKSLVIYREFPINVMMLRQQVHELTVNTRGRGFYEITRDVAALVRQAGLQTGLATLLIRHTSASLLVQENADPEVRRDLERFFARLAPDGDPLLRHNVEGDDDMPAHLRTALTAVSLSVPIAGGELALGTWQGIYLWEHRQQAHRRQVMAHLVGE
jgi:secondary thiamine-phosphate synthase enzyme